MFEIAYRFKHEHAGLRLELILILDLELSSCTAEVNAADTPGYIVFSYYSPNSASSLVAPYGALGLFSRAQIGTEKLYILSISAGSVWPDCLRVDRTAPGFLELFTGILNNLPKQGSSWKV